jgi:hypothetical protein
MNERTFGALLPVVGRNGHMREHSSLLLRLSTFGLTQTVLNFEG